MISFDNATQYAGTGSPSARPMNVTYTMGTGINAVLFLYIYSNANPLMTATFNGRSLTLYASQSRVEAGQNEDTAIYYLINPDAGSHTLSVTSTAGLTIFGLIAASYFGVDQTTPVDALASLVAADGATSLTLTFSTVADGAIQIPLYWITSGQDTFTAVTGTIVVQGNANFQWSMAMMSRGPLSPAGSYSTKISTVNTDNIRSWGISINPATTIATGGPFLLNFM